MVYLMYGAGGTLAVLAVFFLGGFLGWKLRETFSHYRTAKEAQEISQEQRRELAAQQQAFEQMLHYNQDTAYGIGAGVELLGGDDGQ